MADTLTFGLTKRLAGFELDVAGELFPGVTALSGPSGAGKTTLLRCLAGLEAPDSGHVRLGREAWFDRRTRLAVPARRVGFVFDGAALFPHLTALENVMFGAPGRRTEALAVLETFSALELAGRYPRALSVGERQRVAIARAIAMTPRVLLLDEPFSAIDPALRARLYPALAAAVAERELPTLLVTHDLAEAAMLGDRLAVMARGRWLQVDLPRTVLFQPATIEVARLVGVENVFDLPVGSDGTLAWGPHVLEARPGPANGWCVRAGAIEPGSLGAPNTLTGTVVACAPGPEGVRFRVAIAGSGELEVVWSAPLAQRQGIETGGAIALHLPPEAIHGFRLDA